MSNFNERHPPMGSEKDIACPTTSATFVTDQDMINFSSSSEEELDELALRVKALLAESDDEQISSKQREISIEEHSERCKTEDLYSGSDVTIIEDPHLKRLDSSAALEHSLDELEISASTSYYSIDEGIDKQTVDYHLKKRCYGQIPELDTPFSADNELFYYTPCDNKQTLTVDKRSDYSNYARSSLQHLEEKERKECSSLFKYSDNPSLSVSGIAPSKRLDWDNTGDIGYVKDTIGGTLCGSQKKSRKEPEGFTLVAHKISYGSPSKYSKSAKQPLSAKDTDICGRGYKSQVSQTSNLNEKSDLSDDIFIKKDFISRDKSVLEANLEYANTKLSSTSTSRISLGNEPQVLIHSDLSVRPKISVIKPERENSSLKDSQTNKKKFKNMDSEMPKKRVSFSSQTYEGNMKILGFMKSSGGATPLKSFEHPSYQPISDLPEECQKHILSAPIYIDSEMLDSNEYSRFPADNPISSSEVLPHIRWYPIPSYKSSQDIKNAATQTSLKHSKEVGPSSKEYIDRNKNFDDSPEATQHLHTETVDLNTVNLCSVLPDWQAGTGVNLASAYGSHIDHPHISSGMMDEAGSPEKIIPSQKPFKWRENVENSDIIEPLVKNIDASDLLLQEFNFESGSDDNKRSKTDEQTTNDEAPPGVRCHIHDDQCIIPETTIEQEFSIGISQKVVRDACTQVNNCDCFNEFKNMLKRALDKVLDGQMGPSHQVTERKLENSRQSERGSSHSETYDVLFLGDDPHTVVIAEDSPLYFNSFLTSSLRCEDNKSLVARLSKWKRQSTDEELRRIEEQEKTVRRLYRNHAKTFSRKLSKSAVKGRVNYARHERILRKPPFYL